MRTLGTFLIATALSIAVAATAEAEHIPDVQLIINPALNPERDALFVFGLRARLAF